MSENYPTKPFIAKTGDEVTVSYNGAKFYFTRLEPNSNIYRLNRLSKLEEICGDFKEKEIHVPEKNPQKPHREHRLRKKRNMYMPESRRAFIEAAKKFVTWYTEQDWNTLDGSLERQLTSKSESYDSTSVAYNPNPNEQILKRQREQDKAWIRDMFRPSTQAAMDSEKEE